MRILIFGPPGSGKTTQAKNLASKLNLCLVKTGDLIRAKADESSPEGIVLNEALEKGDLADDKIVASLIKERISTDDCQNGFVVDGFPRRLSQVKLFDPKYAKVFYLHISDQVAKNRMLKRGREDESLEVIEERLKVYKEETDPVREYYMKQGILVEIDGEQDEEKVFQDLLKENDSN